jgi:hypothetical protein
MTDTPAALNSALSSSLQGNDISLAGVDVLACTEVSMSQTWTGGKLIFSDSPEKPTVHGQLYLDATLAATTGSDYNRVFLYHVNGHATKKMRFGAIIKNLGTSAGTLTIQKKGTAGPTTAYGYAGKLAVQRHLSSSAGSGVNVNAGAWAKLDSTFDTTAATNNNLMHGIWDYSFTQPHEILCVAVYDTEDTVTNGPSLSLLTKDSHQRGTFPYTDKTYDATVTSDTLNGIAQFPWAGNTTNDTTISGTDVTDGSSQTLAGNYGILYHVHLNVTSSDGRNFGVMCNPRGGAWGSGFFTEAGVFASGKVLIPGSTTLLSSNLSGSVEGKYVPATTPSIWFQSMPAGGTSLPVRVMLVPYTP